MVLLVVALAMLGTATKLKTAKKIEISGAVSGNVNFDGSGNVNIVTTQANIAIITGEIELSNGSGVLTVNTPEGFTSDNSMIISTAINFTGTQYSYGEYGIMNVNPKYKTSNNISVDVTLGNGQTSGPTGKKTIKILLMKIS